MSSKAILIAIFDFIKLIPILDKWAERFLRSYREYKDEHRRRDMEQAKQEAERENNTNRLRDSIGDLL